MQISYLPNNSDIPIKNQLVSFIMRNGSNAFNVHLYDDQCVLDTIVKEFVEVREWKVVGEILHYFVGNF